MVCGGNASRSSDGPPLRDEPLVEQSRMFESRLQCLLKDTIQESESSMEVAPTHTQTPGDLGIHWWHWLLSIQNKLHPTVIRYVSITLVFYLYLIKQCVPYHNFSLFDVVFPFFNHLVLQVSFSPPMNL